jgi:hypothetical protein
MSTATATAEVTLSKADQKKLNTYSFHEPSSPEYYDPEAVGAISVFQYVLNSKGDGLKTSRVGAIRFKRFLTDKAIKEAKAVVKRLNAGEEGVFPPCNVIAIPTGRPRGRRPAAASA